MGVSIEKGFERDDGLVRSVGTYKFWENLPFIVYNWYLKGNLLSKDGRIDVRFSLS